MKRSFDVSVEDLITCTRSGKIENTMWLEKPQYWWAHNGKGLFQVRGTTEPTLGIPTRDYIAMQEECDKARDLESAAGRYYRELVVLKDDEVDARYEAALDDYVLAKAEHEKKEDKKLRREAEYLISLNEKYGVGQQSELSAFSRIKKPDWDYWSNVPSGLLIDLCALALDFDRSNYIWCDKHCRKKLSQYETKDHHGNYNKWQKVLYDLGDSHEESLEALGKLERIAIGNIEAKGGGLRVFGYDVSTQHPIVKIKDFAQWAVSMRISLPSKFPHEPAEVSIPKPSKTTRHNDQSSCIGRYLQKYLDEIGRPPSKRELWKYMSKGGKGVKRISRDELEIEGKKIDWDAFRKRKVIEELITS